MNINLIPYQTPATAQQPAQFGTPFVIAQDGAGTIAVGYPWASGVGGICKEGFMPGQKRTIQAVEYFRGQFTGNIPRGQLTNSLKFTVQRAFTTLDLCLAFLWTHAANVPLSGCLQVTLTGIGTTYLPNAVLQDVQTVKHTGSSCDLTYSFVGSYNPVTGIGGPWQNTKA